MAMTPTEIANVLGDVLATFATDDDVPDLKVNLKALFEAAGLTANSEAKAALAEAIDWMVTRDEDFRLWFTTPADGGPNGDGMVVRHYADGTTGLVPGLRLLQDVMKEGTPGPTNWEIDLQFVGAPLETGEKSAPKKVTTDIILVRERCGVQLGDVVPTGDNLIRWYLNAVPIAEVAIPAGQAALSFVEAAMAPQVNVPLGARLRCVIVQGDGALTDISAVLGGDRH